MDHSMSLEQILDDDNWVQVDVNNLPNPSVRKIRLNQSYTVSLNYSASCFNLSNHRLVRSPCEGCMEACCQPSTSSRGCTLSPRLPGLPPKYKAAPLKCMLKKKVAVSWKTQVELSILYSLEWNSKQSHRFGTLLWVIPRANNCT